MFDTAQFEAETAAALERFKSLSGELEKLESDAELPGRWAKESFASYMDHTVLKAETPQATVEKFCAEARRFGFASVCVNPWRVALAKSLLAGSAVKVATVVGFPLGATLPEVKAFEAAKAVAAGADEIDMVMNIGALKDRDYAAVLEDIAAVVRASRPAAVKVIIETSALDDREKAAACILSLRAGADFVKTSTGFGAGGATVHDVFLMKSVVRGNCRVKASTGVKTREIAARLAAAGAERFGTSSGPDIVAGTAGTAAY